MQAKKFPQEVGDLQLDARDQPAHRDKQGFAAEINPAAEGAEGFESDAGDVFENTRTRGTSMKNRLKHKAEDVKEQIKDKAGEVAHEIRSEGQSLFTDQKNRVAGKLEHFAAVMHDSADKMRQEGDSAIAGYADDLAGYVQRFSHTLMDQDPQELIESGRSFVRRRPELFVTALFFAGMGLARFMKASQPFPESESQYDPGASCRLTESEYAETCP